MNIMESKVDNSKDNWWQRKMKSWLIQSKTDSNAGSNDENVNINGNGRESDQEKEIRQEKEALNKFLLEFKEQTSLNVDGDKLTNAINNFQFYESKQFEKNGYYDGVNGAKDKNISSSAKVRASFIVEHTNSILKGRVNGLRDDSKSKENKILTLRVNSQVEKDFNSEVNELNKLEHRHFSKPTAWFYILIGFSMMFADFPISLGIAKYFVVLPIDFDDTFIEKIRNPEMLLFSLGITFLSIYFKIIYDDYINVGLIKRKRKKEDLPFSTNYFEIIFSFFRFLLKIGILCLLIYLLFNIGNVRNALNDLPIKSFHPEFVSNERVFNFMLFSFIGVTILLPLLSGISFSVGLGILSNITNLSKSNSKLEIINNEIEKIEKEKTNINILENTLSALGDEWDENKTSKLEDLTNQFKNSYLQGYKKGHRVKFGYDIYDNALSLYIDELNS